MPIPLGVLAVAGAGAGATGAFDLLETTVLGSDTASITFSSLGSYSDYRHLQVRAVVRSNRADTFSAVRIRLNNDTGNNYAFHHLTGNGSTVSSGQNSATNNLSGLSMPAASITANKFGAFVMDILDFSSSNKNTTTRMLAYQGLSTDSVRFFSGAWFNTAAVTEIDIDDVNASFLTGSRFSLYGIR